jgi:enamine deaminase RidA (YjgF/YER057c/UK114 family)
MKGETTMDKQRVPSPWGTTFCDSISFDGPGRWIYVSGQIGAEEDGTLVDSSFAAEADQCFARISISLQKAGASMSDVVKITGYVTSTEHYPDYDLARGRAFARTPPSSATVQVAGLVNDARVEVEAVAFVPVPG